MPAERVRSDQKSNDRAPQPARASSRFVAPAFAMEPLQALAVLNFSSPARSGSPKSRAVEAPLAPISASWPIPVEPPVFSYQDRQNGKTQSDGTGESILRDPKRQSPETQIHNTGLRKIQTAFNHVAVEKNQDAARALLHTFQQIVPEGKKGEYAKDMTQVTTIAEALHQIERYHVADQLAGKIVNIIPHSKEEKFRTAEILLRLITDKRTLVAGLVLAEAIQLVNGSTAFAAPPMQAPEVDWLSAFVQRLQDNPPSVIVDAAKIGAGYGAFTSSISIPITWWAEQRRHAQLVHTAQNGTGDAQLIAQADLLRWQSRLTPENIVINTISSIFTEIVEWGGLATIAALEVNYLDALFKTVHSLGSKELIMTIGSSFAILTALRDALQSKIRL